MGAEAARRDQLLADQMNAFHDRIRAANWEADILGQLFQGAVIYTLFRRTPPLRPYAWRTAFWVTLSGLTSRAFRECYLSARIGVFPPPLPRP